MDLLQSLGEGGNEEFCLSRKPFTFADQSVPPECPELLQRGVGEEPGGSGIISVLLSLSLVSPPP